MAYWSSPAKVYASTPSYPMQTTNKTSTRIFEDENQLPTAKFNGKREIEVCEVGEISLPPDRSRVSIAVKSVKDSSEEAKHSVNRRVDYIMQTLHNYAVKDTDVEFFRNMKRVDSLYQLETEMKILFRDFQKCQSVCNILTEKLDESVKISSPEFYHSSHSLENMRKQASLLALHNAKQKAQEMAKFVHLTVGRPVVIKEESLKEWGGPSEDIGSSESIGTVQNKILQAHSTVQSRISVTFELKPKSKSKNNN